MPCRAMAYFLRFSGVMTSAYHRKHDFEEALFAQPDQDLRHMRYCGGTVVIRTHRIDNIYIYIYILQQFYYLE